MENKEIIKIINKEWREVDRSDIPDRPKAVVYTFKQMIISKLNSTATKPKTK